jgi:hypothetical protein
MDLITIPSSGRAKRQQTLMALHKTGITDSYNTVLVVYKDEVRDYSRPSYKGKRIKNVEVVGVPDEYRGISRKREWIITKLAEKRGARYVAMFDDDLSFCHRPRIAKPDMPYINADPYQMHRMIEMMTIWLENGLVHVGLIARQANRKTGVKWQQPGRLMNAYAYDTVALRNMIMEGDIRLGRVPVMEDFDLTLQLLELGFPNRISCRYGWTTTSNLPGGCSTYRTAELHSNAAKKLARLHKPFVKTVAREAKTWQQGFNERLDVRIEWKKALASRP